MKLIHLMYQFLLIPMVFLRYINLKSFIYIGLMVFIPSYTMAGGGSSGCTTGEEACPYEIVLDGDKYDDHHTSNYYRFIVPMTQTVTVNIENEDCGFTGCSQINVGIYTTDSNGSCTSDRLVYRESNDEFFSLSLADADGGKYYCIKTDDPSSWSSVKYDINVTGTATLEAGISDASAHEDSGSMEFTIALTKASSSDVTIDYTFMDGSAINGTNYNGTNGSVTIPAGELSTTISVPLIDTHMTTSKTFTVTISSSDIDINTDSETATGKIIGSDSEDADDSYEGPDICYESRDTSGFCMFGSCMFYQETTHVKAMVDGLEDIDIKKALTRGIAFMNFFGGIGIDDTSKTQQVGDDQAEERAFADNTDFMPTSYYFASMFPKGYDYRLGDGADATNGGDMNKGDTTSYYDKALFKLGLFTQYTHIVTYTKNGETYQEVLQPCNPDEYGSLEEAPLLNECGVFLGALNSATKIKFNSSSWQTINFQDTLNTPAIDGSTGYCSQIGQACPADGIGSNIMDLPTFRSSVVNDNIDIPYSMVISEQHVGNLTTTTDSNTADPEDNRTIVFEAPYSSSYGNRVMFIKSITDHDNHANHYHYVFKRGDYWIGSWDISKNKDVTIETTGDVRFFIQDSFSIVTSGSGEVRIGYHPDEGDTSTCEDPHFYMYLYDDWSINAAGSAHIKNGYIYSKGAITIGGAGAFASYYTAITADGVVTVNTVGSGAYTPGAGGVCKDSSASELFEECAGGAQAYETGPFDAWDIFRSVNNRHISTKIANEEFNLTIASINIDNNATEALAGKECYYRLYDKKTGKILTPWGVLSNQSTKTANYSDGINGAYKQAYVQFKFCQQKDTFPIVLGTFDDCENNATYYEYNTTTQSSDGFAIRPKVFSITTDEDINKLRSGETYSFTIQARDKNGNNVTDYNQTKSALDDINQTKVLLFSDGTEDDPNDPQLSGTLSFDSSSDFNISDGISIDANGNNDVVNISFDDVGKVKIEIQDSDWAAIDVNDTPQSCAKDTVDGQEIDGAFICGDITATYIPYKFKLTNMTLQNHNASNVTYLSSDLNMSVHIGVKIESVNKQNGITKNFDKTANKYENPVALNIIAPNKDINGSIIQGIDHNNLMATEHNVSNNLLGFINGSHTIAWNETNSTQQLIFNYKRQANVLVNPFEINGSDVNISAVSNYSGTEISGWNTIDNQKATFAYARVKATKDFYDDIKDNNVTTPIKVELYCDKWPATSANCPGVDTTLGATNDYRWYISTSHNMASNDGSITLTIEDSNSKFGNDSNVTNPIINTADQGIDNNVVVINTSSNLPSVTNIGLATGTGNTNSWLIYDKNNVLSTGVTVVPLYKVRFVGTATWSGIGETGKVVDTGASSKKSNRLDW